MCGVNPVQLTLLTPSQNNMDDTIYFCMFYFGPYSFILSNLILIETWVMSQRLYEKSTKVFNI
jgi:hypothetical protein